MWFLLICATLAGVAAWFQWYALGAGVLAGLIAWIIRRILFIRKLMNTNDLPICLISSNGTIVFSNSCFISNISPLKDVPLLDVVDLIEQESNLCVTDKTGRHWKLVYLGFDSQTVVYFIATSDEEYGWLYELPAPCCFIDRTSKILGVNKPFLDYVDDNWSEHSLAKYIAKSRLREWNLELEKLSSEEEREASIELIWQNATAMSVRLFMKPHKDGFIVLLYDLSDLENIKQQAQKAQNLQLMGQLTASIVHDFNNLLSAISGFCYLLQEHLPAEHQANRDVREIQNTTSRAQEMTKQLLLLSNDKAEQEFTDPVIVIRECAQTLSMLAGQEISVNFKLPESLNQLVNLSYTQLFQIVMNLIVNAKDADAKDIKLEVIETDLDKSKSLKTGLLLPGKYIMLQITDNGDGIIPQVQDKILKDFFTTKEKGSGIGLATVARMLTLHEGGLDFESGYGETIFRIYIPVNKPNIVEQKSVKILFAEDDALVRDLTKRALEYNGYKVVCCEDGKEALDLVNNGEIFDLLITDAIMPRMNGLKLVTEVRKIEPDMPVVFMSGVNSQELHEKLPDGIVLLQKPMKIKDLIEVLKDILSK